MNEKEVKNKILDIFNKVNNGYKTGISYKDLKLLYLEYLKLSVYLNSKPVFYDDINYDNVNCYMYSLMLDFPSIFPTNLMQGFNIGFISCKESRNELVNLYSDLEALNIMYYEIDKEQEPIHGGYKILMFKGPGDFHFRRENIDGSYSEKLGFSNYIKECANPFNYKNYKFVKALEIVKPTLVK